MTGADETHFNQLQMQADLARTREGMGKEAPVAATVASLLSPVWCNTSVARGPMQSAELASNSTNGVLSVEIPQ